MKALNFSMIKLTIYLALGILLGFYINIDVQIIINIAFGLLIALGISLYLFKKRFSYQSLFGLFICISMLCIGLLTKSIHEEGNFKFHYLKMLNVNSEELADISFRIREELKSGVYHDKYIIDILTINKQKSAGKLLLNVTKDSINDPLEVDAVFATSAAFNSIKKPLNPHQFDYGNYLKKKYIYRQIFTDSNTILRVTNENATLFGRAASFRKIIQNKFKEYNFQRDELAIINALLLGQRQEISKEIYDNYAQAGAIHILAVSGLHVGIILLLLQKLFKPIDLLRSGKIVKTILIIAILWTYALVAGLSASVIRAVTMFTIFAIAMNLKRPTNVFNTIAISIFLLLLFKPNFLFDIGFQLSYMAVLAIVIIDPILQKFWSPKIRLIKFFWRILAVSLSAQIGVIPLSLYYFHQFPGLFVLSNLVIIPCLSAILGIGILVIILSLFNLLPIWLASFYASIISTMNYFVQWVSDHEAFVFQNISFNLTQVFFCYGLIILFVMIIKKKPPLPIIGIFILTICFQLTVIIDRSINSENAFIIFHKSRFSVLGLRQNNQLLVHHNLDSISIDQERLLLNYKVGEDVILTRSNRVNDFYFFDDKKMLVIDSIGAYNITQFIPDIILLRNSPKVNLTRLIDRLRPQLIIFDGSNYSSYQNRWARTCEAKKIPFHQTSKKGAFIYRY